MCELAEYVIYVPEIKEAKFMNDWRQSSGPVWAGVSCKPADVTDPTNLPGVTKMIISVPQKSAAHKYLSRNLFGEKGFMTLKHWIAKEIVI